MAKRLENPDVDDLGQGGVEVTEFEFELLLAYLRDRGISAAAINATRSLGFLAPLQRDGVTDWLFRWAEMQADVMILSICREGRLEAMQDFVRFLDEEDNWP